MKRILILTIAISILMISTATAVPLAQAQPKVQQEERLKALQNSVDILLESKWYKKINILCDKYLTAEERAENKENITSKLNNTLSTNVLLLPFYEFFTQLALLMSVIVDIAMILFGNNPVGLLIGFVVATIIAFIPCVMFDIIWSMYVVNDLVYDILTTLIIDWNELVEFLGIVGVGILAIICMPLLAVIAMITIVCYGAVTVVGLPIVMFMLWDEILSVLDE